MANILLGVTGSVAAIKTPELFTAIQAAGYDLKVVATEPSLYFFDPQALPPDAMVLDADEWPGDVYQRGDQVVHIELRKWADVFLIAPLDANTLAKISYGLADNCLTCVARAWDLGRPMILAPAMNTLMWQHPATARHLRRLAEDRGQSPPDSIDPDVMANWINHRNCCLNVVGPIAKELACGDIGIGGMAEVTTLVAALPR